MALPFIDPFTGSGALQAGWTTQSGASAFTQSGGEAVEGAEPAVSIWTADNPDADQYAEWIIGATRESVVDYGPGAGVRAVTGSNSGYHGQTNTDALGEIQLWEGSTAVTPLGSPYTAGSAPLAGDTMRIEAEGTTIRLKHAGTTRISATDGTYASGNGHMWGAPNAVNATIANFEVGNLVAAVPVAPVYVVPVQVRMR